MRIYMAMGPVNVPSSDSDNVHVDDKSTITFTVGCDSGGTYIVTPDTDGGTE